MDAGVAREHADARLLSGLAQAKMAAPEGTATLVSGNLSSEFGKVNPAGNAAPTQAR